MADNSQVSKKNIEENSINLLSLSVVRRDGSITPFKSDKISNAIKKAFLAQTKIRNNKSKEKEQQESIHRTVGTLTNNVVAALTRRIADGDMIHIEDIQDQVELALMRDEHHKVARAYVLYREQRAASRYHTNKLKEQVGVKVSSLMVLKRDGTREPVSLDKITNRVSVLSTGLHIDPIVVAQKAIPGLYPDITSTEIDNYLAETSAALTVEHPDYSYLAARIKANSLHKETPGFVIATKNLFEDGLLKEDYYNKVMANADEIETIIDYDKDYNFDYFAFTTLIRAYLLKFENKTIERPQDLWMRVALTVSCDSFDFNKVKETYLSLSNGLYTHATPTLFNSGLKMQQLSSCFLIAMEDDSIEGIFNTIKDCALISKTAGGIGMHAHNIRSSGSRIKSTNGKSNGLIPFLKIFNETAKSVDQGGGKRKGSFAIYLEPWHADIEKFLELRKNTGAEEFRARDLFYALWIPDLFMKKVENDEDWSLMSEHECPGLSDCYGKDFEKLYHKYEKEFNIGSPKQLGEILFLDLKILGGKKTKSGTFSTDSSTLNHLASQGHNIASFVLEWRELTKLKSTYTNSLQEQVDKNNRVHTSYGLANTLTGRLSSNDPNLQNIPIRTENGKKIRRAFISDNKNCLISFDYSQIELRLAAEISKDKNFIKAFQNNEDIHSSTAKEIFGLSNSKLISDYRRKAKAINFGILYGISPYGLAKQLDITNTEAKNYIQEYFIKYPKIKEYMDSQIDFAKTQQFVKTIFGRRCNIKGINDKNFAVRGFAERQAINAPIQGSAADIIKLAMIEIYKKINLNKIKAKMLLQVHDELVFEVEEINQDIVITQVKEIMETAHLKFKNFSVPLTVDYGVGKNWGQAH